MSHKVTIVMYHYVRDLNNSRYPEIKGLDYKLFKQQIKFLKENFNVVTMEEVVASIDESYDLPEDAALLTFDDGYIDHFTNVFPILNENRIQGSFFIPAKTVAENVVLDVNKIHFILASTSTEKLLPAIFNKLDYYRGSEYSIPSNEELFKKLAVANRFDTKETIFIKRLLQNELDEKLRSLITQELFEENIGISEKSFISEIYMNRDQIKLMKRNGMHIGLHGYDHYWLGKLDENKMKEDFKKSIEYFDGIIDPGNWVMNYPYGSYSEQVIDYIKDSGCKCGLCTEVRIADLKNDNKYALPRLDTNDLPPKSGKYKNIGV